MEELVVDKRIGFVNHDPRGCLVWVVADIPHINAAYLDVVDRPAGPVYAKGVGVFDISGAPAANPNAVDTALGSPCATI
jgi:xanthine dehydrogenase YagR molybdenum-binding subunit